jgi:type II secretory pathway component PulJ
MTNMRSQAAGFTLIELIIGIAVGLFVVATATSMAITAFKSRQEITATAKLNQELGVVMSVMTNELRRAGFRVCDVDSAAFECPTDDEGNELPYITYASADSLDINDSGDCITYRYNLDRDNTDDADERRGFRLNGGAIEMAGPGGGVACGDDANWVPLTDTDVISITGLAFTTDGSKCAYVNQPEYWITPDADSKKFPCVEETAQVTLCQDGGDADKSISYPSECGADDKPSLVKDDEVVEDRQINIALAAELGFDDSIRKTLNTSVKVGNRQVITVLEDEE